MSNNPGFVPAYLGDIPANSILHNSVFTQRGFLESASAMEYLEVNHQAFYVHQVDQSEEKNYGDVINKYELNSLGYRSNEFKEVPLVTAGCSVTYGIGVPQETIWSTIVAKNLNLEHVNLAVPGWSAEAIVDNLFKYFYNYGNPKYLFVLFPDYNRIVFTSHKDYAVTDSGHSFSSYIKISNCHLPETAANERETFSKKPHDIKNLITPEYGLYRALKSINLLISYCKAANISLVWSTWHHELDKIIRIAKEEWNSVSYSGYVFTDYDIERFDCHQEYADKYKTNFYRGLDNINKPGALRHPGIHHHLHVAEVMTNKLKSIL